MPPLRGQGQQHAGLEGKILEAELGGWTPLLQSVKNDFDRPGWAELWPLRTYVVDPLK